uniref:nucleoside-diphosphate kinase n=1 Tax=Geospiza parvula TaxID=87175 RepID=A0A8C3NH26_GEOPR
MGWGQRWGQVPIGTSGPSTARGAAGTARGPAGTVPVSGGLRCPAVVTGTRAAPAALQERTLLVAKPDALQRRLLGDIIQRFERRGFKLVAMKLLQVAGPAGTLLRERGWPGTPPGCHCPLPQADRRLVEQHYEQLRLKPFYPALVAYMTSGPVVAMVRGQPGGRGGGHGEGTARGSRGRGVLSCPCPCPCPCPAGVGGLQRGAVHAGHGWGQQRRGDNPRGPQRAHHQERGPCQRLHRDGPEGDRLLVPAGRAGGLGQQGQGQHLWALGPGPGRGHPAPNKP